MACSSNGSASRAAASDTLPVSCNIAPVFMADFEVVAVPFAVQLTVIVTSMEAKAYRLSCLFHRNEGITKKICAISSPINGM
mmetsp:Transcript_3050/g.4134  ORF Transcript_3050/g.4134 Transcript_3050/m.4134 type:complete len:82 (+) Transcript_3050:515-760(+)